MTKRPTKEDVRRAYTSVFLAPNGDVPEAARIVIADLARLTGGFRSPTQFDAAGRLDDKATLVAIGRQEVWTYLTQKLNLPERQSMAIVATAFEPSEQDHG